MTSCAQPSAHPTRYDTIVVGGGIAGLTAAWQATREGRSVAVIETTQNIGGQIAAATVGGLQVDIGAEAWSRRRSSRPAHVRSDLANSTRELAEILGLEPTAPREESWVWHGAHAVRIPDRSILGIPADLEAPELLEVIGKTGLNQAMRDLRAPREIGSKEETLAGLVTARLGSVILEKLVRPLAGAMHATSPEKLRVDEILPGLKAALYKAGTLSGAVALLRPAGEETGNTESISGGAYHLTSTLAKQITDAGGHILCSMEASALRASPPGMWELTVCGTQRGLSGRPVRIGPRQALFTKHVVLAGDASSSLRLLSPVAGNAANLRLGEAVKITHATLAVDCPELDAAPRGSGVLVAPGTPGIEARSLTHLTARWPALAREAARETPGRHLLRLYYGRSGEPMPQVSKTTATVDAARLLGVRFKPADIVDWKLTSWATRPLSSTGKAGINTLIRAIEGTNINLTGSWITGNNISTIVPHALLAGSQK